MTPIDIWAAISVITFLALYIYLNVITEWIEQGVAAFMSFVIVVPISFGLLYLAEGVYLLVK